MCGIVGIWAKNYCKDQIGGDLKLAIASLRHRGPDDNGMWLNGTGVALGHTRLSILDLSSLGHQPMVSDDSRYVIVFNGEIYNFAEIRDTLASRGHTFSGSGDTEVILHAFREWGPRAVKRFIGMFAIALWDEQEQRLELYRDRIGVKPLYFGWDGKSLCFGSELRALRAFRHWTPEIDRQSLGQYFQYGYVPDDRSIYKGVNKLRPGHRLTLNRDKEPVVEPYWSILDSIDTPLTGSDRDIESELESLLVDACLYRMVSDVPVGIFLSGGVDSSLVTALLAKHHNQPIQTYTIGFGEMSHDESQWARKVAEHCGTSHTNYVLEPSEALEIARDWGSLFDEPFADSSSIPTLLVSRMASQEVKVVLSADGGDELFSGYNSYQTALERFNRLARLPPWALSLSRTGMKLIPSNFIDSVITHVVARNSTAPLKGKIFRLREILRENTPYSQIEAIMSHWYPEQIQQLLGEYQRPYAFGTSEVYDPAIQMSLRDFHHYLPGDILTKVDRTTMAVSIEGREPLLDHRLAEFAFRLPPHLRRGSLGPKHLLKSILYRHVPRDIVDRPKQGFAIPTQTWLENDFREMVMDLLAPRRLRDAGLINDRMVSQIVESFYSGNRSLTTPLWLLLTFELWRERWA